MNLFGSENFLVLTVFNVSPETLQKERAKIARVMEDQTGLLIEIEKIDSRRLVTVNNSVEVRHHDSDIWFYAIDPSPKAEKILTRNSSVVQR